MKETTKWVCIFNKLMPRTNVNENWRMIYLEKKNNAYPRGGTHLRFFLSLFFEVPSVFLESTVICQ